MSPTDPLIIGFVADLFFTVKIENVARRLGYQVAWIGAATDVTPVNETERAGAQPGEALTGRDGGLFERLTRTQPALLIFDLNNDAVPWQRWLAQIKSSPATRRIPVLCFGSHVETALFTAARERGADDVVAKSRFTSALPELITRYARVPDYAAIAVACAEPLADLARKGIASYNQGAYYDAHHDLEAAWVADSGPARELYRGLLQVGVALYQVQRGNYNGAVKMLLRVKQWLAPLPDSCRGVNVARLREDANRYHDALLSLGAERVTDFDWTGVRPIEVV